MAKVKKTVLYEAADDSVVLRIVCEEKGQHRVYDFVLKEIYLEEGNGYKMIYFGGYRMDPITKNCIDNKQYIMGFGVSDLKENAKEIIDDPQIALMELQRMHSRYAERFKIPLFSSTM